MGSTSFSGPVKSAAGFVPGSESLVSVTSATASVTMADHAGKLVKCNRAAGIAFTLPAATGTGAIYEFMVQTTVTSNNIIFSASGSDVMTGVAINAADAGGTAVMYETAADTNTITMDGTTTGGILGDSIYLRDVGAGLWQVRVIGSATGTEATPFSNV